MTECPLTDRMPDVAHGWLTWTAEEAAHLARCPACAAEWDLVMEAQAAARRGPTPRVDLEAVARRVLLRLENSPRESGGRSPRRPASRRARWIPGLAGLAAAAALLLMIRGAPPARIIDPLQVSAAAVLAPFSDLDDLGEVELRELLEVSAGRRLGDDRLSLPLGNGLAELDAAALERLLSSLEG